MKSSVFFKLLGAFLVVILTATFVLNIEIGKGWTQSLRSQIEKSLQQETRLFAYRVDNDTSAPLQDIVKQVSGAAHARATIIDRTGKVLADSEAAPESMENHAHRPEFVAALKGMDGEASRTSKTLGVDFLYTAAPIKNGAVRLAYPLAAIKESSQRIQRSLIRGSLLALFTAVVLAAAAAVLISRRLQRIVSFAERIAAGNLAARIDIDSADEIARVAMALNTTAERLEQSFAELESSRQQLEAVLNSMQAPVIAVNREERVEWVNGAMNRLMPNRVRLHAPLIETIREPDLLLSVRETIQMRRIHTTRAHILPGRIYEATIAPMLAGSAVVLLRSLQVSQAKLRGCHTIVGSGQVVHVAYIFLVSEMQVLVALQGSTVVLFGRTWFSGQEVGIAEGLPCNCQVVLGVHAVRAVLEELFAQLKALDQKRPRFV